MGINDILHIARSSLTANQLALKVTGQNVSNAQVPGYSRQMVNFKTAGSVGPNFSSATTEAEVSRAHDRFLEYQSNQSRGRNGFLNGRQLMTQQLESIFPEIDGDGINDALGEFFNSMRELSTFPSGTAERQQVAYATEQLAGRISRSWNTLQTSQQEMNGDIESMVGEINSRLEQVARLNQKIVIFNDPEGLGEASDLLDQRDKAIRDLSEMIPISTFTDDQGNIGIYMTNRVLVDGINAGSLQVHEGNLSGIDLLAPGSSQAEEITEELSVADGKGKLSGILYERDGYIEELKGRLDQLAYNLTEQVNAIHSTAFALDGSTGRDFFVAHGQVEGSAGAMALNPELMGNPDLIATAIDPTSVHGDNRAIMAIIDLQSDNSIMGGVQTFNEFLVSTIGEMGNRLAALESSMTFEAASLTQAEAFRLSVAGVSVDEEMVNLITYQRAFEASAKLVSTVDELLASLLAMKQ